MPRLSEECIHKLCSGQVIVGLESAIKELLENALDAEATHIGKMPSFLSDFLTFADIQLVNYGVASIQVSDNGHGIAKADHAILGNAFLASIFP
jgi:DNA mismatch repair protein PMS2